MIKAQFWFLSLHFLQVFDLVENWDQLKTFIFSLCLRRFLLVFLRKKILLSLASFRFISFLFPFVFLLIGFNSKEVKHKIFSSKRKKRCIIPGTATPLVATCPGFRISHEPLLSLRCQRDWWITLRCQIDWWITLLCQTDWWITLFCQRDW